MKKALICLLLLAVCFSACSCSLFRSATYTVAVITGPAGVTDRSAAQGVYRGVNAYCQAHGVSFKEYVAADNSEESLYEQVKAAAKNGAKLMIFAGENMGECANEAAHSYRSTDILTVDCETENKTSHTYAIKFAIEQAAFMAGYAAAGEGYTKIGFLAGKRTESSETYLNAFVRGVEFYAFEHPGDPRNIRIWFSDQDSPSKELEDAAITWFNGGIEVICVCGDGIYRSLNYAANISKKPLIGCGLTQAGFSERYITTAASEYQLAVENTLADYFENGGWDESKAGKAVTLDVKTDMVGLPNDIGSYRFKKFSKDSYETLYARIKYGTLGFDIGTDFPANTVSNIIIQADGFAAQSEPHPQS